MGEVLTIAIFFIVIVLTAVVFSGWVAYSLLRVVFRGISSLFTPPQTRTISMNTARCNNRGCGAQNPTSARFCRRCGNAMPSAQHVQVRRAAVW